MQAIAYLFLLIFWPFIWLGCVILSIRAVRNVLYVGLAIFLIAGGVMLIDEFGDAKQNDTVHAIKVTATVTNVDDDRDRTPKPFNWGILVLVGGILIPVGQVAFIVFNDVVRRNYGGWFKVYFPDLRNFRVR